MLLWWFTTSVELFHQLPRSSVNSLSQACKRLQGDLEPVLYTNLNISLSRTWFKTSGLEELLATSPVGLKWTSTLSNCVSDSRDLPDIIDDGENYYEEDRPSARLGHDMNDLGNWSCSRFWKLATLFQLLIKKLPRQTLKCFR